MDQQQRKVIRMGLRLELMKHSKTQTPETGMHIDYDLTQLREDPQKIERWAQQSKAPPGFTQETTAAEDWGQIKEPIQQALQIIYPKNDTRQENQTPEWAKKPNNGAREQNGRQRSKT